MLELAQLLMSLAGFGLPLGIMLLMSGRVKIRNELDTLTRAICAFIVAFCCYWLIGHGLFTGSTLGGFIGLGSSLNDQQDAFNSPENLRNTFLFSIPAIMAITAMSERGSFLPGTLLAAIVSIFVVPVTAHWAWASDGNSQGWLSSRGFADYGGATVIFASAGFSALATSITTGPRMGRFPLQLGRPGGQSPTFNVLGMVLMVFGLSTLSASHVGQIGTMSHVVFKVLLGASFAALTALILLVSRREKESAMDLMTAALAGGVALTAFAPQADPADAALIGLIAGAAAMGLRRIFAVLEVDDPGDLIAAFLAGGIIGALITPALFSGVSQTMAAKLVMQALGIATISLWSFGITFLFAQLLSRLVGLRVDQVDEARGLSRTHFGLQSELDFLVSQLQRDVGQQYGSSIDGKSELSRLANGFSECIVRLRNESHRATDRIQSMSQNAKQGAAMAAHIRLAEDTLRVKSEDILLLLESVLLGDSTRLNGANFQNWLHQALQLVMEPTLRDLDQFVRHLPLQAELEELENIILAAADTVARSAHRVELLRDLSDAQVEGFFSRDHNCDLAQLLEEKSQLFTTLSEVHNNPIQIDCPVKEGLIVAGDINAFTRILTLSIEGAFNRLLGPAGKPVRIELREQAFGQHIVLECLDTGTALSSRQIRAIRDPLAEDQNLEELGLIQILPLMLAARLVDAVGGELSLSSEHGLGTLLHCRFRKQHIKVSRRAAKVA